MAQYVTLDVGTTAVKAGVFDASLRMLAIHIEEYSLATPAPGIVELDPDVYWRSAVKGIRRVLAAPGVDASAIATITCSTQGETLIPVSAAQRHLHNAIVWLDGRATEQAERIAGEFDAGEFYATTGQPDISPICPVSKVLWLKENVPGIYDAADKILLLEDYLIMRLSGEYATNPAVMCSTGYFDIHADALWDRMLDHCGIDARKFAPIVPCGTVVGNILPRVAEELGLPGGVMVTTGAMDQVAAAIGSGNVKAGVVGEITGTALGVTAFADAFDGSVLSPVNVYKHAIQGKYLLFSFSQTAGMVLKWFRDEFCRDLGDGDFDALTALAAEAPPLSGGLTVYPQFTGAQIPENNAAARGVFFGAGLNTGRPHFIRAILESVGYMLRENIEAMGRDFGLAPGEIYSLGGGAKSRLWLGIKADINRLPLVRLEQDECTSLGAAILGGVAAGHFSSIEEAAGCVRLGERFEPDAARADLYEKGYATYRELYPRLKTLF